MGIKKIQETILQTFPDLIDHMRVEHIHELYIEIPPERIREVSVFLHQEMGYSLLSMIGMDQRNEGGFFSLRHTFGDYEHGILITTIAKLAPDTPEFSSIADVVHSAALYEREVKEMYGLEPIGHPNGSPLILHGNWPEGVYPLRKDFKQGSHPAIAKREIPFSKVEGEGVFEIPVGPVHAGIIEPGHFRFSVAGEPIIHLEAQLGYVHKGIEKLAEGASIEKGVYISERISGDETFANSLAYCIAVEKIAGIVIPKKAKYQRVLFAELERLTAHLGDLAGICLDVAYGFGCFQFRMMRGWAYLVADELCGMRFLRSVNKPGGLRKDFLSGKEKSILSQLKKIDRELGDTWRILRGNSLFADRVEHTGVVSKKTVLDLHGVGPAARAAGVTFDVRKSFPYSVYGELNFTVPEFSDGDVNARMKVKLKEAHEAIQLMIKVVEESHGGNHVECFGDLPPYQEAYGIVEAPRGESIHYLMVGEKNEIYRYKIRTASFCNWPVLCHAVQGNIVPDFPLINKSFNLSYAGNDL